MVQCVVKVTTFTRIHARIPIDSPTLNDIAITLQRGVNILYRCIVSVRWYRRIRSFGFVRN